jgi:hypothetical protein
VKHSFAYVAACGKGPQWWSAGVNSAILSIALRCTVTGLAAGVAAALSARDSAGSSRLDITRSYCHGAILDGERHDILGADLS